MSRLIFEDIIQCIAQRTSRLIVEENSRHVGTFAVFGFAGSTGVENFHKIIHSVIQLNSVLCFHEEIIAYLFQIVKTFNATNREVFDG